MVNAICRSVCHQIRNIGRIRCFLSRETCKQIVHASVTSRLDFCNALLVGLPDSTVGKLQRCQNMAARVVRGTRKCDHITPVLMQLHWLPVVDRVHFTVLLQVYKALHGLLPRVIWWTSFSSTDPVVRCVLPLMATLFNSPGLRPPGVIGPSAD